MKKSKLNMLIALVLLIVMTFVSCAPAPENKVPGNQDGTVNPDKPADLPVVSEDDFTNGNFVSGDKPVLSDNVLMKDAVENKEVLAKFEVVARDMFKSISAGQLAVDSATFKYAVENGNFTATTTLDYMGMPGTYKLVQTSSTGKWSCYVDLGSGNNHVHLCYYFNEQLPAEMPFNDLVLPEKSKMVNSNYAYQGSEKIWHIEINYALGNIANAKEFLNSLGLEIVEHEESYSTEGRPDADSPKYTLLLAQTKKALCDVEYVFRDNDKKELTVSIDPSVLFYWRAPKDVETTADYLANTIYESGIVPENIAYCKMNATQRKSLDDALKVHDSTFTINEDTGEFKWVLSATDTLTQRPDGVWYFYNTHVYDGKQKVHEGFKGKDHRAEFELFSMGRVGFSPEISSVDKIDGQIVAANAVYLETTVDEVKRDMMYLHLDADGKYRYDYHGEKFLVSFTSSPEQPGRVDVECHIDRK